MKKTLIPSFLGLILLVASAAFGGTKEEILRLQSDVLAMQNQLRLLEKNLSEQSEGIKSLVVQLNDQVGKSNQLLGKISAFLDSQVAGEKTSSSGILQEIRNLGTKLDDNATRISALAQQVADLKVQSKPITQRVFQSPPGDAATMALSADAIYNEAYNDLIQGNLDLAIEGFTSFIKNFPNNEKADDAQYNIGAAHYNAGKVSQAMAAFTKVVNDYPSGDKVASALFKRGKAELSLQETDNAVQDFKTVVEKYPASPEAGLAKAELEILGVDLTKPQKAAPVRRRKP